jgi:outer membrane protein
MKNNIIKIIFICLVFSQFIYSEMITPFEAYKLALDNSNELKAKEYQVLSKEEALNQYYARLYPTVSASINYNDTNYERNELIRSSNPKVNEVSLDYMVSLRQTLYDHELYTKIDVEKKRNELYNIDYKINTQKLAGEVLSVYLEIFKSKNKINLLGSSIDYSQQKLRLMEQKFEMKLANKMDFLEAKVEFDRNRIELVKEKKIYDMNMLKLKQLINKEDIEIPVLDLDKFSTNVLNNISKFDFKEEDIKSNLEIVQAQLAIEMSRLEVKNAFSAHYPKLTFDARYTLYESDDATTDYENYSRVAVNLEIPLYQGGAISSRVEEKRLLSNSAYQDLQAVEKDLKVKFAELKSQLKNSTESMSVYNDALLSAKTYEESINLGYKNSLKSIIDVYEARNKIFEIEAEYIQNIQNFIDSYVGFLILTDNLDDLSLIDTIIKK